MSQITRGVRAILSHPTVYSAFQSVMGAHKFRQNFVADYIKPFPGMQILDIGCGPADILAYLPDVDYWGFDISPEYIAMAQRKHGDRGRFQCKFFDIADLRKLPKFDVVLLSGVLHHIDDQEVLKLVELVTNGLKRGGRLLTTDPCLTPEQNPLARYLISKDRGQNVRDEAGYRSLVKDAFFDAVDVKVVHTAWIPYTHCYMVCTR